jgi:predicted ATP-grasp superfamily ATP-dependent carboligase
MGQSAIAENARVIRPTVAGAALPPVIILNMFYSGLGIARQLYGTGVRVVGLSAHPGIYGSFTRLCEVRAAPNSQEQAHQLAELLLRSASELGGAIIFPTRDADLLFLDRFHADLAPLYRLAIPPRDVLDRVMNKAVLADVAMKVGIAVPRTTVVEDRSQLPSGAALVGFPCVVKPVSSVHWRQGDSWKLVGGRKAFRADNLAELQREYDRISRVRRDVLLQEWIPGETDQIVVWGGYIRHGQEPLAFFTARKRIQSPDEFGTGCVVESDRIPDLLEPSVRLCRALGYEGIAEIEYKRDACNGTLKLVEMNARHWDWHELGRASRVNLTWAAYCHLAGQSIRTRHRPVQRAKWIAEDALLMHTLESLSRARFGQAKLRSAFGGECIYGIFAWNDPLPFLRYSLATLFPAVAGAALRRLSHRVALTDRGRNSRRLESRDQAKSEFGTGE